MYVVKQNYNFKNLNTGKEGYATRVFNVTVNHSRQVMHSTPGASGSFNDKTLVRSDTLAQDMHHSAPNARR